MTSRDFTEGDFGSCDTASKQATLAALVLACAMSAPVAALLSEPFDRIAFRETAGTAASQSSENSVAAAQLRNRKAIALLDHWEQQPATYDRETWPAIADAIDQNRTSDRKLFR